MSRWDTYLTRLDEKVSKKEIKDALKNDSVLIGCEFEFKLDNGLSEFGSSSDMHDLWDKAYDEAKEYNDAVDQYERDRSEYEDETQELRDEIERKEERITELEGAIEDQGEHNDELDTNIEEAESDQETAESELETHEDDKDVWVEEGNLDDWEAVKRELNTRISNAKIDILRFTREREKNDKQEEEWQDEIDKLERDKDNDESDVKYREEEGLYEEVEEPYVGENTMPNFWEYMTDYMGYGEQDLYTEPGEYVDLPPEWESGEVEDLEQAVEDSGILSDAPFDNYEIGTYGSVSQTVGSTDWAIEDDSSLGDDGLEVKNPPMELPEFMEDYLHPMFSWIQNHGFTDSDCGFHCHMSLKDTNQEIDFLKLIMFTDEGWIYNAFTDRASNTYANSVKNKLKSKGVLDPKQAKEIFSKKKLMMKMSMSSEHFDAINNINGKGHVEFRYMGGRDYHRKGKEVETLIGMYAHNLSLAMDPNYKKKEYILKLQRVFNKIEMFQHKKNVQALRVVMQKIRNDGGYLEKEEDMPKLQRIEKEEVAKFKRLSSTYKLDGKTEAALKSNKVFMVGVAEESNLLFKNIGAGFEATAGRQETSSWY